MVTQELSQREARLLLAFSGYNQWPEGLKPKDSAEGISAEAVIKCIIAKNRSEKKAEVTTRLLNLLNMSGDVCGEHIQDIFYEQLSRKFPDAFSFNEDDGTYCVSTHSASNTGNGGNGRGRGRPKKLEADALQDLIRECTEEKLTKYGAISEPELAELKACHNGTYREKMSPVQVALVLARFGKFTVLKDFGFNGAKSKLGEKLEEKVYAELKNADKSELAAGLARFYDESRDLIADPGLMIVWLASNAIYPRAEQEQNWATSSMSRRPCIQDYEKRVFTAMQNYLKILQNNKKVLGETLEKPPITDTVEYFRTTLFLGKPYADR